MRKREKRKFSNDELQLCWSLWRQGLALTAGYVVAFPVNYILVGKGVRHVL